MKPSKTHKNKQPHNWLVYKNMDELLLKNHKYYKGTLYDLGCGDAIYRQFFLQFVDKYLGVDWSNSPHDLKADIIANLNEVLPISSEVADTVISISVLEHLYNPNVMLNEAYRILKTTGTIVLQVPWQWWIHEAPHDYYRYTPYAIERMLKQSGFKNIQVIPTSGFFTTWFLKFNYFSLRLINSRPRLLRGALKMFFLPIWYMNQTIAPYLDRLDKNWAAESQGYFVVANK